MNENIMKKIDFINSYKESINIMEVCGTHTMAIGKYGIRQIINDNINLISGPGCPVCVTPNKYIDYIYELSLEKEIIVATYGDMIRVPGSTPYISLEKAKAQGANVKLVYSSLDALKLAEKHRDKKVVFLGIGFETTAPATAIAIKEAYNNNIDNFHVLSMHKIIEPVMSLLLEDNTLDIQGFLCPGHVAVVIGEQGFKFIDKYNCASAITGFDLEDILSGLVDIIKCIKNKDFTLKNSYNRLVKPEGNKQAKFIIEEVFCIKDDEWRGLGTIRDSSLKIRERFSEFDIEALYPMKSDISVTTPCQCGEVLKGSIKPCECKLFHKVCNPDNPIGPCMVSSEGSCAAYYRYG
ncbi:hydrogenase formation protein HypD [Desnuesiella massiliensis]|uniref:hydrogenase formation protein HypD n=1 Tax=Desnuesiella massiliensis TaxID=1650662 RepID=UPI0006E20545|nr:hydrogenase formation protein HypD [Desnuesiella massiliensis]